MYKNRFRIVFRHRGELAARTRRVAHLASFGLLPDDLGDQSMPACGGVAFLQWAWTQRHGQGYRAVLGGSPAASREAASDDTCIRVWEGLHVTRLQRRHLERSARCEESWGRKLVLGMTLGMLHSREGSPVRAAVSLALAADAYRGFLRLQRWLRAARPQALLDYEEACRQTLGAFEPPVAPGRDFVRTIVRVARQAPRRQRARPSRVIDALDAVITAGHGGDPAQMEERVVQDVARMLGGRVILHYADGRYRTLRPQSEHTLSTWSIHVLVRETRLRARSVRPRPEFWRPEQRRPGALLSFPIGDGVAAVGRRQPFQRREIRAVRTVLRFFEARRRGDRPRTLARAGDGESRLLPTLAGDGLIGNAGSWRRVLRQVGRVAQSRCSVILLGETGTGKERLARAIHAASPRAHGPFVAVNCGAVPVDLLGSELFGHIRGAFTGADRAREGYFVQAHHGTLFLDEVADMSARMQVALLRVLEERQVVPVGSVRARPVDVRVLCATNKDIEAEVRAGRFRQDLYHRLDVVTIRLPPLRERLDDIPLLARHLLSRTAEQRTLHPDAYEVLGRYAWPGNVRELDNVLRAASLLEDDPQVTPKTLERILEGRRQRVTDAAKQAPLGPRLHHLMESLGQSWRSAPELADELRVSSRTVNRDLADLMDRGLVMAHGEARARRYRAARARRDLSQFGIARPTEA